jgi:PA14 domain
MVIRRLRRFGPSRSFYPARLVSIACLSLVLCRAQEPLSELGQSSANGSIPTFGVTVVDAYGLRGLVYLIPEGSLWLPNFRKLKPIGALYTSRLNIPPRNFTEGFPGITNRFEWFAIDYTGRFWIDKPGNYRFALLSDDGSKLYIDNKTVIDNDGGHPPRALTATVKLRGGIHIIRVSYFQGPGAGLALILEVAEAGAA